MKEKEEKETKSFGQERFVSPEEKAWLHDWLRESLYDEYMERRRELWLRER